MPIKPEKMVSASWGSIPRASSWRSQPWGPDWLSSGGLTTTAWRMQEDRPLWSIQLWWMTCSPPHCLSRIDLRIIGWSVCLSVCLSTCLSVYYMSVCLHVFRVCGSLGMASMPRLHEDSNPDWNQPGFQFTWVDESEFQSGVNTFTRGQSGLWTRLKSPCKRGYWDSC